MTYKLGSLFDGSGGFPLAGSLCGIEPVWASEIEPYPIAVTKSRFPNMKHLGDISKINGTDIEPVDIITFGSPCQDMSVAGKRAGLKHEANGDEETTRSGLFMEAVRIIKEMREKTNGEYPRFAVWENVPGAFSSNKGEDFRIVLEELIKVAEPYAVMPDVPKKGWAYADCFSGDGWSLAYRVFDAQYWGVPQRRRRIYLVADFGGQCARQILFEREGLRGYFTQSREAGQAVAADAQGSVGADDHLPGDCVGLSNVAATLRAGAGAPKHELDFVGRLVLQPVGLDGYNATVTGDKSATLGVNCGMSTGRNGVIEQLVLDDQGGQQINVRTDGKVPTLRAETHGNLPCVMEPCFCLQGNGIDRADTAGCNGKGFREGQSYTLNTIDRPAVAYQQNIGSLCARDYKGVGSQYVDEDKLIVERDASAVAYGIGNGQANQGVSEEQVGALNCMHDQQAVAVPAKPRYIVRRLTPTECARLQGFPDTWGHIDHKAEFTDEEYRFWLNARKTFDVINGRAIKDYNEKQMLTWYNKLHTDSA